VSAVVGVHDEVFGGDHEAIGSAIMAALDSQPRPVEAVVAVAGTPPSLRAGWSSLKTGTLPVCGAGEHCRAGEGAGCSGRWSLTAPG
jgi:hypothetical protein